MAVGYQGSVATLVRFSLLGYTLILHLSTREGSRLYVYDLIDPMMVKGERGYKGKPLRGCLI